MGSPTLVICGNGASAVTLLHAIASSSTLPIKIFVIGTGESGEGLAYATRNPGHLLNTPAGRMSIDPDEPDQFVHWLQRRNRWTSDWASQFVPRGYYAEYLREAFTQAKSASAMDIRS